VVCGPLAGACFVGSRWLSAGATVAGVGRTAWSAWQGGASIADIAATIVTTSVGSASKDPKVVFGAGFAQFVWDTFVSPPQR
jgi:hypothetical protein